MPFPYEEFDLSRHQDLPAEEPERARRGRSDFARPYRPGSGSGRLPRVAARPCWPPATFAPSSRATGRGASSGEASCGAWAPTLSRPGLSPGRGRPDGARASCRRWPPTARASSTTSRSRWRGRRPRTSSQALGAGHVRDGRRDRPAAERGDQRRRRRRPGHRPGGGPVSVRAPPAARARPACGRGLPPGTSP